MIIISSLRHQLITLRYFAELVLQDEDVGDESRTCAGILKNWLIGTPHPKSWIQKNNKEIPGWK